MQQSGNGFADTGFNGDVRDLAPIDNEPEKEKEEEEEEVAPEDSASQVNGAGKPPKKKNTNKWWDSDKSKRTAKDKLVTSQNTAKTTAEALIEKMKGTLEDIRLFSH